MTMHAKAILSAVGIAAALASPAMARSHHHAPSIANAQANARAYAGPRASYEAPAQTVYAPDVPVRPHNIGLNPDSQLGSENN